MRLIPVMLWRKTADDIAIALTVDHQHQPLACPVEFRLSVVPAARRTRTIRPGVNCRKSMPPAESMDLIHRDRQLHRMTGSQVGMLGQHMAVRHVRRCEALSTDGASHYSWAPSLTG